MVYILPVLAAFLFGFLPETSAQTRECPTATLAAGETVTGAIETGDCRLSELISGSVSSALSKRYRLEASGKAVFSFSLAATGYTPILTVFNAQSRQLAIASAVSGGTARITINLPAGLYSVISSGTTPGTFELKAAQEAPRSCPFGELPESGRSRVSSAPQAAVS